MRSDRSSLLLTSLAMLAVGLLPAGSWAASGKLLHYFNGTDGTAPSGLIFDASGNLYGTSQLGGSDTCSLENSVGCGLVFELTPDPSGGWSEKVLHYFTKTDQAGFYPNGGLVLDDAGKLYGTTSSSSGEGCGLEGQVCGTVFELTPTASGEWREKVLHTFGSGGIDGKDPRAGLVMDAAGNLYGTTWYGGNGECFDGNGSGCGTVFKLTPGSDDSWKEEIVYAFKNDGSDGIWPGAALIMDASGDLYGTNFEGGVGGYGTVFELIPTPALAWEEKILHSFVSDEGNSPSASLVFDASGNLYGTTYYGPAQSYGGPCQDGTDLGCGTAFELTPTRRGTWTEKVLHYFKTNGKDGFHPSSSLVLDSSGELWGTTAYGGADDYGAVYKLVPDSSGWVELVQGFDGADGVEGSGLAVNTSGYLYGTAYYGGADNDGTVFEIKP